ncbi:FAD-dependent oxidoreductase [Clostridiaceae bacterium HSG29]|nr:FAD-dependent oxidoreductase [Clostridiaceae bacterium HSG29]
MYDVIVIGGGPAGMAAAIKAKQNGSKTLIIEREKKLGGILKQCIHDGFGLIKFKKQLTGPEYAQRYTELVNELKIETMVNTYVSNLKVNGDFFEITIVNRKGIKVLFSKALVLANGCRERSVKQIFIDGTRPSGVFTAGTAQYLVNRKGYLPCKNCIILGSGDIGLIMARRLKLEGANVLGVYEVKNSPSGLTRNIIQCLDDYNIPLYLSKTISTIHGKNRVIGVDIVSVDENLKEIPNTKEYISCDGVILSVGLIPENENAESLNVSISKNTKGPIVDQNLMTSIPGVFSCGNALHVNDLVDYVSESGEIAGLNASKYAFSHYENFDEFLNLEFNDNDFLYVVPQKLKINFNENTIIYFRVKEEIENCVVRILYDNKCIYEKKYNKVKPPEMERIILKNIKLDITKSISLNLGKE